MTHYKDGQNNLYYLSEQDISNGGENLLPTGCIPISDNEAESIRDSISTIPLEVTRLQAFVAMDNFNLLSLVEEYMGQEDTPKLIKLAYANAQIFRRDSPTIQIVKQQLQLTDEQLDQLFIFASTVYA